MESELAARLERIEAKLEELDARTAGSIRFGPGTGRSHELSEQQRAAFADLAARVAQEVPPVDRSARTLADGAPVSDDHRETLPDGQQRGYVVLSGDERAKGFVRPVRRSYRHKACGTVTTMSAPIAETYARDPEFYVATFCCACRSHLPLDEFVWEGTDEVVGS